MPNNIFEQIKKVNEHGQEFWSARDLYKLLGYTEYGKFLPAIERAKESCKNSGQKIDSHFAHVSEPQKHHMNHFRGVTKMIHVMPQ